MIFSKYQKLKILDNYNRYTRLQFNIYQTRILDFDEVRKEEICCLQYYIRNIK